MEPIVWPLPALQGTHARRPAGRDVPAHGLRRHDTFAGRRVPRRPSPPTVDVPPPSSGARASVHPDRLANLRPEPRAGCPGPGLDGRHGLGSPARPIAAARERRLSPVRAIAADRDRAPRRRGARPGLGLRLVPRRPGLADAERRRHRGLGGCSGPRRNPVDRHRRGSARRSRVREGDGFPLRGEHEGRQEGRGVRSTRSRSTCTGDCGPTRAPSWRARTSCSRRPASRSRWRWPAPAPAERPRARWTTSCVPMAGRTLAAQLNSLDQELAGHNATWTDEEKKTHALSLRIANTAFGQRGYPIEQAFLDAIAEGVRCAAGARRLRGRPGGGPEGHQRLGQPPDRTADPGAAQPGRRDERRRASPSSTRST